MSKQQKHTKQHQPQPPKKKAEGDSALMYVLRNLAIVAVLAFLFFVFDKHNEKQGQLQSMYQQFSYLRQTNADPQQLQQLYNEIIEIQNDTSFLTRITRGYHWAIHDLALENLGRIDTMKMQLHDQHIDSTEQSLMDWKMNTRISLLPLLKYVNEKTPKDAVILLPPGDSAISNNSKWNFIYDPEWTEYFIYPRLCVAQGHEADHPDLAKRANYILIIEGKGYEKLKYDIPLDQRPTEAVLPIDHPPAEIQKK